MLYKNDYLQAQEILNAIYEYYPDDTETFVISSISEYMQCNDTKAYELLKKAYTAKLYDENIYKICKLILKEKF